MESTQISADLAILLRDPDEQPNTNIYKTLSSERLEIRLLKIWIDRDTNILHGTIQHASLYDESVQYEALSYRWGPPVDQRVVVVDGKEVLIRVSLFTFFESLCSQPGGQKLPIWADAICINQKDTSEKSWQVAMMGKIFSQAHQVLIWLGRSSTEAEYLFRYLRHYQDMVVQHCRHQSLLKDAALEGIEDFAKRKYWTRLWTVQEIMLARNITIWCGNLNIAWSEFLEGLKSILSDDDGNIGIPESLSDGYQDSHKYPKHVLKEAIEFYQHIIKLRVSSDVDPTDTIIEKRFVSMFELLDQFHSLICENQRDRVYALVNIARDGSDLKIDYHKSMIRIWFDVFSLLCSQSLQEEQDFTGSEFADVARIAHVVAELLSIEQVDTMTMADMLDEIRIARFRIPPFSSSTYGSGVWDGLQLVTDYLRTSDRHIRGGLAFETLRCHFHPSSTTSELEEGDFLLSLNLSAFANDRFFAFRPSVDRTILQFIGLIYMQYDLDGKMRDDAEGLSMSFRPELIRKHGHIPIIVTQEKESILHLVISHDVLFYAAMYGYSRT